MNFYRVVGWKQIYENNRTREMKNMTWVPVQNRHDGDGFCTVMSHPDGIKIYGCWMLILQIASKGNPRGTLRKANGEPYTAKNFANMTKSNEADMLRALEILSTPEVGWLEQVTTHVSSAPQEPAEIPQEPAEIPQEPARKGREGKGREGEGAPHPAAEFSQEKHPEFYRLVAAAKDGALDDLPWATWRILLHNYGLDSPASGMTEKDVVDWLLPMISTCPVEEIKRKGSGAYLGWKLTDLVKRPSGNWKKNGAAVPATEAAQVHNPSEM